MNLTGTYKTLCTEFYDLDKPEAPPDALEYYSNQIKTNDGPVLEPMCGSGRFLVPMIEKGYDVKGTDTSGEMLESCRLKLKGKNLTADLKIQRLQDLSEINKYKIVYIPSGSFGLITDETEAKESLKRIFKSLKPGGVFLTEIETPLVSDKESKDIREVSRDNFTKIILSTSAHYNIKTNIEEIKCEYCLTENNILKSSETELIKVKHYSIEEFRLFAGTAGFKRVKACKPYTTKSANENDNDVLFECLKIQNSDSGLC